MMKEKKNTLIKLINEAEKQLEKNKLKRAGLSFLVLFVLNFAFLGCLEGAFEKMALSEIVSSAVLAAIYTVVLYFSCAIIFSQLIEMNRREENRIERLKKELSEIE